MNPWSQILSPVSYPQHLRPANELHFLLPHFRPLSSFLHPNTHPRMKEDLSSSNPQQPKVSHQIISLILKLYLMITFLFFNLASIKIFLCSFHPTYPKISRSPHSILCCLPEMGECKVGKVVEGKGKRGLGTPRYPPRLEALGIQKIFKSTQL